MAAATCRFRSGRGVDAAEFADGIGSARSKRLVTTRSARAAVGVGRRLYGRSLILIDVLSELEAVHVTPALRHAAIWPLVDRMLVCKPMANELPELEFILVDDRRRGRVWQALLDERVPVPGRQVAQYFGHASGRDRIAAIGAGQLAHTALMSTEPPIAMASPERATLDVVTLEPARSCCLTSPRSRPAQRHYGG